MYSNSEPSLMSSFEIVQHLDFQFAGDFCVCVENLLFFMRKKPNIHTYSLKHKIMFMKTKKSEIRDVICIRLRVTLFVLMSAFTPITKSQLVVSLFLILDNSPLFAYMLCQY